MLGASEGEEGGGGGGGGGGEQEFRFSAKLDNVSTLANLLKTVSFCEKVNLFITENGIKFVVEEGKFVQAYILMQNGIFQRFHVSEDVEFKIPLKELLECLKILGNENVKPNELTTALDHTTSNSSLTLMYHKFGSPFELILEERGIRTDFTLKTEEVDDLMEFDIDPVVCKISMKANLFFELLAEIDNNSPEFVDIIVNATNRTMVLSSKGISGLMEVLIPETSGVVEYFEFQNSCKARYRMSVLKYAFKAIQLGNKVLLKMNAEGIMSLSFILPSKADSYVEFFSIPLGDADDEVEEPSIF